MVLTVKVPAKKAQEFKNYLMRNNFFDKTRSVESDKGFVYFPIHDIDFNILKKEFSYINLSNKKLKKIKKEKLEDILTKKDLKILRKSYDVIGPILILEIPKGLIKKEKTISKYFLKTFPNIKTVVKKKGPHLGKYRIQKYELIAGEPKYEVIHKENQLNLKLNINETYYSPRSANERMRIARLVKPNESVLVMFSGIGPYALVLSKFSRAKKIIGVEINEKAHEYALENAKLNKSNNIEFYKGDVNKIVPKLNEKFDRIIMPLPKTSVTYLPLALKYIKHSGIIHFYDFSEESKIPSSTINKIQAACEKSKRKFKILKITKCGQQSPRVYRVCADFQVT